MSVYEKREGKAYEPKVVSTYCKCILIKRMSGW